MPDYSSDYGGRYMKAAHITEPFVGVVERVAREDVDRNGKMRTVIYFEGVARGVVCNGTRYDAASRLIGSRNTDNWPGVRIGVRRGETSFGGMTTDCIEFVVPEPEVLPGLEEEGSGQHGRRSQRQSAVLTQQQPVVAPPQVAATGIFYER